MGRPPSSWRGTSPGWPDPPSTTAWRIARIEAVVALHNNTEDRYSLTSYLPQGSEAASAARVSVGPGVDRDDFVFTTDAQLFEILKGSNDNVVLQAAGAPDDGSLSVALAGHSYANVEAEHGHREAQRRMADRVPRGPGDRSPPGAPREAEGAPR